MGTVSIIIPAKNESENLPLLFAALAKQTFQPQEVIVADAQSTDNTREIASAFGAKVVEGGLPAVGRNRGASIAKGDILLFLDADVHIIHENFLKNILEEFEKQKQDIGSANVFLPKGALLDKASHALFNAYSHAWGKRLPHAPGCCILVRKKVHDAAGGFDEQATFCEDHEYARRLVKMGARFGFLKEKVGLNTRRQDLEGRVRLVVKYALAEMHLMFIGPVHNDVFKYHFDYPSQKKKEKESSH